MPATPTPSPPLFPVRTVVLGVLLPSLVFEIGIGALLPVVPSTATQLGANLAVAGFLTALVPVGKILADLPAGALAARIGDRGAMLLAGVVATAAYVGVATAPALWLLAPSVLLLGAATAVFNLARHAHLTEITPPLRRARVLSTLAGVHRIGLFLGPFVGAAIIAASSVRGTYWLGAATAAVVVLLLLAVPERSHAQRRGGPGWRERRAARRAAPRGAGIRQIALRYRHLFRTLGVAVLLVGAVRGARQTVLPLWGEHQGFDPEVTSLIFGLSGALDMLLFYPAGKVMDRFGRLWIGVPSMLVMGVAMALLPFAHGVGAVAVVAALLGLGNGVGSGIIMTLGADVAPPADRATFLGVWRLFQDTGDAAGPLVISVGTALGSLAAGIWATSTLGLAAAATLQRWVPRFSVHANLTTRRRAGLA